MIKNAQLVKTMIVILFTFALNDLCFALNKSNVESSDEKTVKHTKGEKAFAPVVDIMPYLRGMHDYNRVHEEMRLLKELGFERVYFVLCNPGYPVFSNPSLSVMPPDKGTGYYTFESLIKLGDPNWAYMYEAQKLGMEAWAIIKPYESGGGITIPHGATAPTSISKVETVGGQQIYFDNLLSGNPELRVIRRPDPNSVIRNINEPVTSVELAFCLDSFKQKSSAEKFFEFNGVAESEVKIPGVKLWISKDNGRYTEFEDSYKVLSTIEYRKIEDVNGFQVCDTLKRCLVMTIKDFEIPAAYRYLAVTLDEYDNLYTIPYSMIRLFGYSGEIPGTKGIHVRISLSPEEKIKPPEQRIWGLEGLPIKGDQAEKTFTECGFEFEWHGTGFWGDGWVSSPVFGIGRGNRKYMHGTPCEAYPEVQEYWLEQVRRVMAMGFDGIDFRLQNHSSMVTDYVNYGYNEPIIKRYKEANGIDILKEEADPLEIMRIRGEYFLDFLEKAADIIHSSGKKLQVHLRYCYEDPKLSDDFNELGFWAMPKILPDWKKAVDLADEITLKHYYFNNYQPNLAIKIKTYAKSQGKKVWVHCYIGQGKELNINFFDAVEADDNIDGILLYEVDNLIETYGLSGGYKKQNVGLLRSIMEHLEYK
jgi:hypothetical protein